MATIARNVRTTLEMIKIEHTLFALPFAFLGAMLAARGLPSARQIIWISLAMVGARSTAMAFNRIADKDYDTRNPRTKMRAIPTGILSVGFVMAFTVISAALFLLAAAMLNRLTLILSPIALASVVLYSYTKRWTMLSHLVLGWCLSIAPMLLAVAGVVATGALLIYQHTLVQANDLSRLNAAFFTTNAFVSVILFASFGAAVLVARFF